MKKKRTDAERLYFLSDETGLPLTQWAATGQFPSWWRDSDVRIIVDAWISAREGE